MTCLHATLGCYQGVFEHFQLFLDFILRNKTIYFSELGSFAIPLPFLWHECFDIYLVHNRFGRHRHHGPVIAVIECPNIQLLKSGIRSLEEFPCVTIPSNARDSQYQVNPSVVFDFCGLYMY